MGEPWQKSECFSQLPFPVFTLDGSLKIAEPFSRSVDEFFGECVRGRDFLVLLGQETMVSPGDRERVGDLFRSALNSDELQWILNRDSVPKTLVWKKRPHLTYYSPLANSFGDTEGFLVVVIPAALGDSASLFSPAVTVPKQARVEKLKSESIIEAEQLKRETAVREQQQALAEELLAEGMADLQDFLLESISEVELLKKQSAIRSHDVDCIEELVRVGRPNMDDFFAEAFEVFSDLKVHAARPTEGQGIIFILGRYLHTLKGDSSMYGFTRLSRRIHEFEDALVASPQMHPERCRALMLEAEALLRDYAAIAHRTFHVESEWVNTDSQRSREFRVSEIQLHSVLSDLEQARSQLGPENNRKISEVIRKVQALSRQASSELNRRVEVLIHGLEEKLDKRVDLDIQGEYSKGFSRERLRHLQGILGHLIRNSMDHGIEDSAERKTHGKPEKGKITLRFKEQKNGLDLEVMDDGRGVDLQQVIKRAIELSIISEEKARALSLEEQLNLIFEPRLSTRSTVSLESGRGMGMLAAKLLVEEIGGLLTLENILGKGLCCRISLPD